MRIIRHMLFKTSVRAVVHPPVHGIINPVYVQFWQLNLWVAFVLNAIVSVWRVYIQMCV